MTSPAGFVVKIFSAGACVPLVIWLAYDSTARGDYVSVAISVVFFLATGCAMAGAYYELRDRLPRDLP